MRYRPLLTSLPGFPMAATHQVKLGLGAGLGVRVGVGVRIEVQVSTS